MADELKVSAQTSEGEGNREDDESNFEAIMSMMRPALEARTTIWTKNRRHSTSATGALNVPRSPSTLIVLGSSPQETMVIRSSEMPKYGSNCVL